MSSCSILLIMGIPASGKTTLCNDLKASLNLSAYHILHFPFDELIANEAFLQNDFNQSRVWRTAILYAINDWIKENICSLNEKKDLTYLETAPGLEIIDKVKKKIDHLVQIRNDWTGSWVIVLDDNFCLQSMRHVYYTLAKHYRLGFGSVFCNIDINSALSRNALRPTPVNDTTIEKMAQNFQKPDTSNIWEQFTLCLTSQLSSKEKLNEIANFINMISTNPFSSDQEESIRENRLQSQIICSSNLIHQFDECLRKSVSRIMLIKDRDWKRQNGKCLSEIKTNILDQFKRNELNFEIDVNDEELTIQKILAKFELSLNECKS